jgi:hypothetical protein
MMTPELGRHQLHCVIINNLSLRLTDFSVSRQYYARRYSWLSYSRGSYILAYYMLVKIMFCVTKFKEVDGNNFMSHNEHVVCLIR